MIKPILALIGKNQSLVFLLLYGFLFRNDAGCIGVQIVDNFGSMELADFQEHLLERGVIRLAIYF